MPGRLEDLLPLLGRALPALVLSVTLAAGLWLVDRRLARRERADTERLFTRQIVMLGLTAVAIVLLVLVLPLTDATRGQLLALVGLMLTAILTISSTSFVANAMAGLMLRSVRSFAPGDFIKVAEQFGRVTERSLFHTELQTEDRDLTTLPNLYLVTNPVTVVRSSGTIVSATVSLGYDAAHDRIEPLLAAAAEAAGLESPFVHVLELGDFAVTYRVAGVLRDVSSLLSTRSRLRACMLDGLHGAGVEIVSPAFMNQRRLEPGRRIVPTGRAETAAEPDAEHTAETLAFDKAEHAALLARLREEHEALAEEISTLEKQREANGDGREDVERRLAARTARLNALARRIETAETDDA